MCCIAIITKYIITAGEARNVTLSNTACEIESCNVTIEWAPPTSGENVSYSITTTPEPLFPATSVTTTSTNTHLTVEYSTSYTITVTTPCGLSEHTSVLIGT